MRNRPAKTGAGLNGDRHYTVLCLADVGFNIADQTRLRQAFQRRLTATKDGRQASSTLRPNSIGCLAKSDSPVPKQPRAPRVKGGQVLYLDFDGVLHRRTFASTPSGGCTLETTPRPMVHATVTPIACLNMLRFWWSCWSHTRMHKSCCRRAGCAGGAMNTPVTACRQNWHGAVWGQLSTNR